MIHQHSLRSAVGVGLALAISAASPATARPDLNPPLFSGPTQETATQCIVVCSDVGSASKPHASAPPRSSGAAPGGGELPQAPAVRVITRDHSFDWGDAAVGAGGAITLVIVAAGGAYATGGRRVRRLSESSARPAA